MADPADWAEIRAAIADFPSWERVKGELTTREIALLWVLVEEFNILRALHGLPDRTLDQAFTRLRNVHRLIVQFSRETS